MEFEFSEGGGGPPAGMYKARLDRVEPREKNEFGNAVRFVFKVTVGDHADEEASRIVGVDRPPTSKNALGRLLAGLNGGPISVGQKIDPGAFIGREYLLQVGEAPHGNGTRVESVLPPM